MYFTAAIGDLAVIGDDDFLQEGPVSKQIFSKARASPNPEIAEIHSADASAPAYAGMRLLAIGGTDIALENSPALKEAFGRSGPLKETPPPRWVLLPMARPLDRAICACQLAPCAVDERDLSIKRMERLTELELTGSLLLFDRWYPSRAFLAHTLNAGFPFAVRGRGKWNLEVGQTKIQGKVTLCHDGQVFSIRVLKICLAGGETETLAHWQGW